MRTLCNFKINQRNIIYRRAFEIYTSTDEEMFEASSTLCSSIIEAVYELHRKELFHFDIISDLPEIRYQKPIIARVKRQYEKWFADSYITNHEPLWWNINNRKKRIRVLQRAIRWTE